MTRALSAAALALIIRYEVSDENTYNQKLRGVSWPGGYSGLTIGIGYDLGYVTGFQFRTDWGAHLDDRTLILLEAYCGKSGPVMADYVDQMSGKTDIPYDVALAVFLSTSVPKHSAEVAQSLQNTQALSDDSYGALVSLFFNRGSSMALPKAGDTVDRRKEMRQLRDAMAEARFNDIPGIIQSMKRLWPDLRGLRDRRDAEATLFATGLMGQG